MLFRSKARKEMEPKRQRILVHLSIGGPDLHSAPEQWRMGEKQLSIHYEDKSFYYNMRFVVSIEVEDTE